MIAMQTWMREFSQPIGPPRPPPRTGNVVRLRSMAKPQTEVAADELTRLLRAVADKNRDAFARLFEYFAPRIKSMMMSGGLDAMPAEDVAQDTMMTVWRKAHLYDPVLGSASAWIYTIARNRRIDVARSAQRAPLESPEAGHDQVDDQPLPDDVVAAVELENKVRIALAELKPDQQHVVKLSFFENRSHAEIAERLNLPLGTVKSRIRLAAQRLRDLLGEFQ
jgi:RNA polymerase sigma-70 factor, ECF subfamily